jgi:hypothetical protein
VVGNDVGNEAEIVGLQRADEAASTRRSAKGFADPAGIDDVVSVSAAVGCFEDRRTVQVGYAQRGQVRRDTARAVEVEVRRQLQTVRGQNLDRQPSWKVRFRRGTGSTDRKCMLCSSHRRAGQAGKEGRGTVKRCLSREGV